MDELSQRIFENSIRYLHGISESVTDNNDILKSFYASKFRILEVRGNMCLPVAKNKLQERCTRCCLSLNKPTPSCQVKPHRTSPFAKKVLEKRKHNKVLTRFQERYLKKLGDTENCNELVVTCNFCKKSTSKTMPKPIPPKPVKITNNNETKKRKKSKKTDKFCGLQRDVVVSVQKNNQSKPVPKITPATQNRAKSKEARANAQKKEKLAQLLKNSGKTTNKNKLSGFLESCFTL